MKKTYQESERLNEIITSQGWNLYDATQRENQTRPFSWAEFEKKGPSTQFEIGHNYIFAPIPRNDESLRDAYSVTKGLGPSLKVEDVNDDQWAGAQIVNGGAYHAGKPVLFSRLDFDEEILVAFSPATRGMLESDALAMFYPHVIDTFEKYFRIVTPDEYGLTTPIPMHFHVEDN